MRLSPEQIEATKQTARTVLGGDIDLLVCSPAMATEQRALRYSHALCQGHAETLTESLQDMQLRGLSRRHPGCVAVAGGHDAASSKN